MPGDKNCDGKNYYGNRSLNDGKFTSHNLIAVAVLMQFMQALDDLTRSQTFERGFPGLPDLDAVQQPLTNRQKTSIKLPKRPFWHLCRPAYHSAVAITSSTQMHKLQKSALLTVLRADLL